MKRLKKIVTIILTVTIIGGSFSQNVFASENQDNQIVSLDEYETAMSNLYAQYGIAYEVLQSDTDVVLTKEILNEQLANARQTLEANKENSNTTYVVEESNDNIAKIVPFLMPVSYSHTSNVKINSPSGMGYACFDLALKATVDAQYNKFIAINSYTCTQSGAYLNLKSWSQTPQGYSTGTDPQLCSVSFKIVLTVEYKELKTGLLVGYTSNHNIIYTFAAYW